MTVSNAQKITEQNADHKDSWKSSRRQQPSRPAPDAFGKLCAYSGTSKKITAIGWPGIKLPGLVLGWPLRFCPQCGLWPRLVEL